MSDHTKVNFDHINGRTAELEPIVKSAMDEFSPSSVSGFFPLSKREIPTNFQQSRKHASAETLDSYASVISDREAEESYREAA